MNRYILKVEPKVGVGGCQNVATTLEAECKHYRAFLALVFMHSKYKSDQHLTRWLLDYDETDTGMTGYLVAPTLSAELTILED